jgi:hypothetical protein
VVLPAGTALARQSFLCVWRVLLDYSWLFSLEVSMSKEAMKLALEALRLCTNAGMIPMYLEANQIAIKALEEALAKQEQGWTPERIAGMARLKDVQDKKLALAKQEQGEPNYKVTVIDNQHPNGVPLEQWGYTTPQQRKQEQSEPVAIVDANDDGYWADILPDRSVKVGQLLYTTPQQRTWVELTDEEIEDCYKQGGIGRALQMLKEKNT